MTTWTIDVPACDWLTSNPSRAGAWRQRSETVRAWRQAVFVACRAAKLPQGVTPVRIRAVAYFVGRAPVRDRLNLAPTMKAVVDGLCPPRNIFRGGKLIRTVGYGFLPDDSDDHVLDTTWTVEPSGAGNRRAHIELQLIHEPTEVSVGCLTTSR